MSYEDRQRIIRELQDLRGTKIVTHVNSDRRVAGSPPPPGLTTKLATEAQPYFYQCLREVGHQDEIDLFLYSSGGQTDSVWPLVSLFREFCSRFNVLVPYKAHSAGTLLCLGANTTVMGEAAELSPVDPSIGNQFSPLDETTPGMRKAISVEDVISFFSLASNPAKIREDQTPEKSEVNIDLAFKLLAEQVHPLALGNVNRSHVQIRELGRRLLELHTGKSTKDLDKIVRRLTQERYSHTDILNRKEAKELLGEDIVVAAEGDVNELLYSLYNDYTEVLSLDQTFVISAQFGNEQQVDLTLVGSFIETVNTSMIFRSNFTCTKRTVYPQGMQVNLQPGQFPPLLPGFPVEIHIELKEICWIENEEGI